jgi:hypothetical protein
MACRGSAVRIRLAPYLKPLSWRGFLVPERQAEWAPHTGLGAFLGALFADAARPGRTLGAFPGNPSGHPTDAGPRRARGIAVPPEAGRMSPTAPQATRQGDTDP